LRKEKSADREVYYNWRRGRRNLTKIERRLLKFNEKISRYKEKTQPKSSILTQRGTKVPELSGLGRGTEGIEHGRPYSTLGLKDMWRKRRRFKFESKRTVSLPVKGKKGADSRGGLFRWREILKKKSKLNRTTDLGA